MENRTRLLWALVTALAFVALAGSAQAVRIKDICTIEGVRGNQLMGYGLVVGLDGTGDDTGTGFTQQSLVSFMRRHGIQIDANDIDFENVAAVIVTATLPPFAGQGTRIDVNVASVGDAEDLHGGVLLSTPLRPVTASPSKPGSIYAVAQGPVSTGGFTAGKTGGSGVMKNHPTVATVPGGALVEREVQTAFATKPEITLQLRNPDFTTAQRVAQAINTLTGGAQAKARNSASVTVAMPSGGSDERVGFIAEIEDLMVSPDSPARVVYNERTGTIVMGSKVRISEAIITHGSLVVSTEKEDSTLVGKTVTSGGLADTTTVETERTDVRVEEQLGEFRVIEEGVTIGEVAKALNTLGVSARDIIAILQALKECGALQAELVSM